MKKLIRFIRIIYQLIPGKLYIFRLLRKFYSPSEFMINQLYFRGVFKVNYGDKSFKMKCHNRRGFTIENRLFWNGNGKKFNWENQSVNIWSQVSKNAEVVFDIGANTGYYTLLAKSLNENNQIYGFEPVNHIYNWYTQNCQINHYHVNCFNLALSDKTGTQDIYLQKSRQNIYSASLNKDFAEAHSSRKIDAESVPVTTLEEIINKHKIRKIDLMKIDVEGLELEVLKGMNNYLELFKPSLLIEVLSGDLGIELTQLLKPLGYLFYNLNKGNSPQLLDRISVSKDFNFFICQKKVAESLSFN